MKCPSPCGWNTLQDMCVKLICLWMSVSVIHLPPKLTAIISSTLPWRIPAAVKSSSTILATALSSWKAFKSTCWQGGAFHSKQPQEHKLQALHGLPSAQHCTQPGNHTQADFWINLINFHLVCKWYIALYKTHLLSLGELPIDRPTTSNIRAVAAVLRPKVKEHHVSILDCLVVGSSSVTIMQNSSACSSCCYAVVAHMPEHRQKLGRLAKLLQQEMNLHYVHLAPP